ncbi:amidohydrolase [Microtetraspora sp. NBRC 13810]|nr:amidohydrolase [Microtetraspora sp. NBRC 13810]
MHENTIAELAARLRSGAVSAAELARRTLDAVAGRNAELGAFAAVDAEGAREAARRADAELAAGVDRGPLHGVPVAVKDNIDVAGLPVTRGSAHFAGRVAERDAECVRRLRTAGAVIVGTTTMHEVAYGPTGDRSVHGPARNPRDPARMSGGSSGGAAVAVAAGLVPLAVGTDTGGSVRIPAALCGVAGFKPAFGALPTGGVFPLAATLDHVGLIAGTAADCLLAYRALVPLPGPPRRETPARIGWAEPGPGLPIARPVAALARRALLGQDVTGVELPALDELHRDFAAVQSSEAYAVHADRVAGRPELFDPEVLDRLKGAAAMPGWRYVRALAARDGHRARFDDLFARFDLLALPTVGITAPPLDTRQVEIDGVTVPVRDTLLALTSPWNLTGLPALTVPAGTLDGLPVGLQLVCPPGREHMLFAVADLLRPAALEGTLDA